MRGRLPECLPLQFKRGTSFTLAFCLCPTQLHNCLDKTALGCLLASSPPAAKNNANPRPCETASAVTPYAVRVSCSATQAQGCRSCAPPSRKEGPLCLDLFIRHAWGSRPPSATRHSSQQHQRMTRQDRTAPPLLLSSANPSINPTAHMVCQQAVLITPLSEDL